MVRMTLPACLNRVLSSGGDDIKAHVVATLRSGEGAIGFKGQSNDANRRSLSQPAAGGLRRQALVRFEARGYVRPIGGRMRSRPRKTGARVRLEGEQTYARSREDQVRDAVKNVIRASLCAKRGDQILLIFDQLGQEVADSFIEGCVVLRQPVVPLCVPVKMKEASPRLTKWKALADLVRSSTAMVTALTDSHAFTGFRGALLDMAVKQRLRTVHMPGVGLDVFLASALEVDFHPLDQHARQVAGALTSARSAQINTRSQTGQQHQLYLSLRARTGHADGGIALPAGLRARRAGWRRTKFCNCRIELRAARGLVDEDFPIAGLPEPRTQPFSRLDRIHPRRGK